MRSIGCSRFSCAVLQLNIEIVMEKSVVRQNMKHIHLLFVTICNAYSFFVRQMKTVELFGRKVYNKRHDETK